MNAAIRARRDARDPTTRDRVDRWQLPVFTRRWERVLHAFETQRVPRPELAATLYEDNDLFWLLHPDAFRRLLSVLGRVDAPDDHFLERRRRELEWAYDRFASGAEGGA